MSFEHNRSKTLSFSECKCTFSVKFLLKLKSFTQRHKFSTIELFASNFRAGGMKNQ